MDPINSSPVFDSRERAFAQRALKQYQLYLALGEVEQSVHLKTLFNELATILKAEFVFWGIKSGVRGDEALVHGYELFWYKVLRAIIGVEHMTIMMLRREEKKVAELESYCIGCLDAADKKVINTMNARARALIATYTRE